MSVIRAYALKNPETAKAFREMCLGIGLIGFVLVLLVNFYPERIL